MSDVIIKKGTIEIRLPRTSLISADETHDGMVFNFKSGLHLYLTDPDMPLTAKELIKQSVHGFGAGKLIIDLLDYNTPARIDAT